MKTRDVVRNIIKLALSGNSFAAKNEIHHALNNKIRTALDAKEKTIAKRLFNEPTK